MKVAVVGCAHGELDLIYSALSEIERTQNIRPDLVICPGDFQAVRNTADLQCMACPPKFKDMRTFWRYYAGISHAPVPTIFVGGNHEASNHLQEIPLGGLVAPNMYFLGNAGVVNFRGLRIAGVSGVYTDHNYHKKRFEAPPYPRNQIKSVYHTRREDIQRLLRVRGDIDIFISHDWPRGVVDHGNIGELLSAKPFLRGEINNNSFGNPGAKELLDQIQPKYWFAAHMHVKFPALVSHASSGKVTRFLALDKALPKRDFVQILDIPLGEKEVSSEVMFADRIGFDENGMDEFPINLDAEWLTILRTEGMQPGRETPVSEEEIQETVKTVETTGVKSFICPVVDFVRTGEVHDPNGKNTNEAPEVCLQERNKKLLDALQLSEEAWIAQKQSAVMHAPKDEQMMTPTASS